MKQFSILVAIFYETKPALQINVWQALLGIFLDKT